MSEPTATASDLAQLSARIADHFHGAFGRTPLAERVQDILAQATTLGRFADLDHLKDETGDLLCSVLQLCTECGWDPAALAEATLAKIAARQDFYARLGTKLRKGRRAALGGTSVLRGAGLGIIDRRGRCLGSPVLRRLLEDAIVA
jgi:hypothetical protein